jgi:hypothetical protein
MRKSTLFVSAVLTTFVMAMLAGVASAYQNVVEKDAEQAAVDTQAQTQPQPQVKAISHAIAAESQFNLTPEEAAGLAAQVIGREDLYSVEVTDLDGESVFMVTFSSGDLVYVSMDGQIRSIGKVQVETVVVNNGGGGGGGGGNSQPAISNQSREDHDDDHDDDHEEHEEHDDDHEEHEEHDEDHEDHDD